MPALLLLALLAPSHSVGLSRGVYVVDGADVDVEVTFARPELLRLLPGVDGDGDGAVSDVELDAARPRLGAALQALALRRGEARCDVAVVGASLVEEDGVTVALRAACGPGGEDVVVDFGVVDVLGAGHRHLGRVEAGGVSHDVVAFAGAREFTLSGSAAAPPVAAYLGLGVEHILLGFDHLVFLVGVLIALVRGGRLRDLFVVVTAFTLAHSITLALAATGAVTPPSSVIEPLIAASIVFVGVESWFARSVHGRWKVTLPFGLIHGFGFAGALQEIGLPRDHLIPALGLFNLGVEAGQLAVVAVVAPLLLLLRSRLSPRWRERVVVFVAVAVAGAGAFWLLERTVFA
jgi:hypothetical protein